MYLLRTLKIPVHYATTKEKMNKLNKLTARLTYVVKLWSELIDKHNIKTIKEIQDLSHQHRIHKKTKLSAGFVQQAGNKALWAWKTYRKKLKQKPNTQKPFSKNKRIPVRIDYRTGAVKKVNLKLTNYGIEISTLKKYEKMFLLLNPSKYHLNKLSRGEVRDFEIVKRGSKYYAYIVCSFGVGKQKPSRIRGIDLGINRSITTVLLSKTKKPQIDILVDTQKQELLEKYDQIIAELQQANKKKKLKQLSDKRRRIAEYFDRTLAKQLTQLSEENEIVAIGNPHKIREINKRGNYNKRLRKAVHKWAFKRMLLFITEKYNEKGIKVLPVNEKYTSKRCCLCNSINTERPKQSELVCLDCNREIDADINGAINIALHIRNYRILQF